MSAYEEARKLQESVLAVYERSEFDNPNLRSMRAAVMTKLAVCLMWEARALRANFELESREVTDDGLAHTDTQIKGQRARERLGQAERLMITVREQIEKKGLTEANYGMGKVPQTETLWTAEHCSRQITYVQKLARQWDGEEDDEEMEEAELVQPRRRTRRGRRRRRGEGSV